MIKLSVIIPVYKVEKYIIECLESVCCQLVDGVEVILVNDGTPDNAMLMAHQYISKQYTHLKGQFVFIDQENQGLSGARNTGISVAKGEYIAFLDSDDKLSNNYIEEILKVLQLNLDIDIIQFDALRFNNSGSVSLFLKPLEYLGKYQLDNNIYKFIFSSASWFAWLRVYKRKLFDIYKFPVGRNYEDAYLIPKIFAISKNIYFLNSQLIWYRENLQGISNTFSSKNIDDLEWVATDMLRSFNYDADYYQYSILPIFKHLLNISYNNEEKNYFIQRSNCFKKEFRKSALSSKNNFNLKNKFFCFFPVIFIFILNLKHRF
ncbi:glycosyltransferase family 2 protein [Acinetobacter junii]|uniref:glycosyltransferase family 2 protein n=1 Tax=Acinetobacter junii TaxID=40215 RepID=UPI00124E90E8|nr:glycosyltransferase [Acinetobacter junii]